MTDSDEHSTDAAAVNQNNSAVTDSPVVPEAEDHVQMEADKDEHLFDSNKLGILNDVAILLTIEVGRTQIKIRDLLNLTKGSVLELDKLAGDPVDIYANGKLISTGNIITANGKYCVRLTSIPEDNKFGVHSDGK